MNKVIQKAIEQCGNRRKLANACNVSVATVGNWLGGSDIYGSRIPLISKATKGKVSEKEILKSLSEA